MKTYLSFKLPEDQIELDLAQNGHKYARVISDFRAELRVQYKYQDVNSWDYETIMKLLSRLEDEIFERPDY